MKPYVTIDRVQLSESEVRKIYEEKKYIVTNRGVSQVCYSSAQQKYYGYQVIKIHDIARRGRYYVMDAKAINRIIGNNVLVEN